MPTDTQPGPGTQFYPCLSNERLRSLILKERKWLLQAYQVMRRGNCCEMEGSKCQVTYGMSIISLIRW